MNLSIHPDKLTIYLTHTIPKSYISITKTRNEVSVVARTQDVINAEKREDGWRALSVDTQTGLDFSLLGIIARVTTILATAEVSVFVMSTFMTDYILVKSEKLDIAKRALEEEGIRCLETDIAI